MLHLLADLLFPPRCRVCRAWGDDLLCPVCRAEFVPLRHPLCVRCGIPLDADGLRPACGRCRREPPPYAAARSAALYTGRLRAAIHRLKFEGRAELGPALGNLLGGFVCATPSLQAAEVIVPVPLHRLRLRERGYNHAALIARGVAEVLRLPLAAGALLRVAPTLPQTDLGRRERYANVRGAFQVDRAGERVIRGRAILIIDDVLTSGATAAGCVQALLAAGAVEVRVATLARALPDGRRGGAGEAG